MLTQNFKNFKKFPKNSFDSQEFWKFNIEDKKFRERN